MTLIRVLDFSISVLGLLLLSPVLLVLLVCGWFDTGSPLFIQERVGRFQKRFYLVKFRTMSIGTQSVASHLAGSDSITSWGDFLRKTKLDELPQLWNVLKGDMSLVGPRPCLFSQIELIEYREQLDVFSVRPGITGLSQLSGVDMSTPEKLAQIDAKAIGELSLKRYFSDLLATALGKGSGDAAQ